MTETKHTPGKWAVHQRGHRVYLASPDKPIAEILDVHNDDEACANICLLCHAPELLEALEENVRLYCQTCMHCTLDNRCIPNDPLDRMPDVCKMMAKNKQLIAKAKGGSE